jgi:hypothetical protein
MSTGNHTRCGITTGKTYYDRIAAFGLDTLELRRLQADMLLMHDLVYRHSDIFDNFFKLSANDTRGHSYRVTVTSFIPKSNSARNHSVWPVHNIWSSLSEELVSISDRARFMHVLKASVPSYALVPTSNIRL